ncbi:hypothetical protein [uncultured Thiodictyon sp.]|uniref:hypothetical protein n=1 Tax=uncultured Thiodictyon sp. TaxID=1846217 RepID=UPI0025D179D0|nr:hypothetical protein [uncultured Thiodictyon sp.]
MSSRYDPKNPRPGWNPGPMNTILDAIDHQPLWGGITTAWRRPYSRNLTGVEFDINELTPQYEPPAGLTAMNICTVSNWCLRLLMDGRKSAGLTLDHVVAADG